MTNYNEIKKPGNRPNTPQDNGQKSEVKKVVTGEVKKVKKGLLERMVLSFIGPDGIQHAGRYVMHEVISPALKDMIVNSITSGINTMVYRDDRRGGGNSYNKATGYYGGRPSNQRTNYSRPASNTYNRSSYGPTDDVPVRRNRFNSEEFTIPDRNEALSVLDQLSDLVENYGVATIADFYDSIGIASEWTDQTWGWTDLATAGVHVYQDSWVISMPPVEKIK